MCSNHTGVDFFAPINLLTEIGERRMSDLRGGWELERWVRSSASEAGFFASQKGKRGWRGEVGLCERFFCCSGIS